MLYLDLIRIEGFKALDPVEVRLDRGATFFIGSNGVGKSSILQALSFVRAFGEGRCENYFASRDWDPKDIYPKTQKIEGVHTPRRRGPARPVRMSLGLRSETYRLFWEFSWSSTSGRSTGEYLFIKSADEAELIFSFGGLASDDEPEPVSFNKFKIEGSLVSIIKPEAMGLKNDLQRQAIQDLNEWFSGITSLELLSPIAMRGGARGKRDDIGSRGEYLASFLASISTQKRDRIVQRVQSFYPLEHLNTTKKRAGWVDMQLLESFRNFQRVSPLHMSDGFFRILALCSIPEFEHSSSLILLDEVEDGIEPHVLPHLLKRIDAETDGQLVLTSHSPLLVNFFEVNQIVFIARDIEGRTRVANPKEIPNFEKGLEYFGSGEIWANSDRKLFYESVRKANPIPLSNESPEEAVSKRAVNYLQV